MSSAAARPPGEPLSIRLRNGWRALAPEHRLAGLAAAVLVVSMALPWYDVGFVPRGATTAVHDERSALAVFTWVEAAVLLVAGAVGLLVWARSERRAFHLPGGDGTVLLAAGIWTALLVIYRFFDKPDVPGGGAGAPTVGITWGILVALAAAAALALAGARLRALHRSEPQPEPPPRTPRPGDVHAAPTEPLDPTTVADGAPGASGPTPQRPGGAPPGR